MQSRANKFLIIMIILSLTLRLYQINSPYTDKFTWKQTQTAMISRNMYRNFTPFTPKVDFFGGDKVIEGDFPIIQILTSFLYHILGMDFWVGRIIPILSFLISLISSFKKFKEFSINLLWFSDFRSFSESFSLIYWYIWIVSIVIV